MTGPLNKRMKEQYQPARPRPDRAERQRDFFGRAWLQCMRCGQLFWSLWSGHRHCDACQHKLNDLSGGVG